MKSPIALVVAVGLVAAACGKSRTLTDGGGGAAGAGHGGATGAAGRGGAAGAAGIGGATSAAGSGGTNGTAGAAAGATGAAGAAAGTGGAAGAAAGTGGAAGAAAGTGGAAGAAAGTGGAAGGSGGAGASGRGGNGGAAGSAAGAGGSVAGRGGSGADAGATGRDGGGDVSPACATGDTRCDTSGRRLRCAADGSWADDDYVCTVALSGSSDYNTMCALKADGRLACWASGDWANGQAAMMVARAPAGTWKQISVGDDAFSICALAAPGTVSCWAATGSGGPPWPAGLFTALAYSVYGSCAITDTGTAACFNGVQLPADFVGRFKQIATANVLVYGIDENDALHAPSFVLPSYPAAKYKQITANNSASCALRDDGAIFCYPVSGMLPPPTGSGFLEVAATYGNDQACAIRNDGTVTCWLGLSTMQPLAATPSGTFTHIAGCESTMCGIRTDGTTVCWGSPGMEPLVPPVGW